MQISEGEEHYKKKEQLGKCLKESGYISGTARRPVLLEGKSHERDGPRPQGRSFRKFTGNGIALLVEQTTCTGHIFHVISKVFSHMFEGTDKEFVKKRTDIYIFLIIWQQE